MIEFMLVVIAAILAGIGVELSRLNEQAKWWRQRQEREDKHMRPPR